MGASLRGGPELQVCWALLMECVGMWCCVVEDLGIMKKFQMDRGAIKSVLVSCARGLKSAGSDLDEDVPVDLPVEGGLNHPLWPNAGTYLSAGGGRFCRPSSFSDAITGVNGFILDSDICGFHGGILAFVVYVSFVLVGFFCSSEYMLSLQTGDL